MRQLFLYIDEKAKERIFRKSFKETDALFNNKRDREGGSGG